MYPKVTFRVHITLDMYPKWRFWVHIYYLLPIKISSIFDLLLIVQVTLAQILAQLPLIWQLK